MWHCPWYSVVIYLQCANLYSGASCVRLVYVSVAKKEPAIGKLLIGIRPEVQLIGSQFACHYISSVLENVSVHMKMSDDYGSFFQQVLAQ